MKPNFIFIGPDKSGSTWLWQMLAQHPEVYVARCKDIYYFDRYYSRGMRWYESHFHGAEGYAAVGELSHDYLTSPEACTRIKADLPGVKLVTILRDPVDRAFSEYLFMRKHRMVKATVPFREAAHRYPSVIEGGMYGRLLEKYVAEFGQARLFVGDYADIAARPFALLARLCAFLEVDPGFRFREIQRVVLSATDARIGWLAGCAKYVAVKCRDIGLENFVGKMKQSSLVSRILYKEYRSGSKPTLSAADRNWLRDIYAQDVNELGQRLGRSFGTWLRPVD